MRTASQVFCFPLAGHGERTASRLALLEGCRITHGFGSADAAFAYKKPIELPANLYRGVGDSGRVRRGLGVHVFC